MDNYVISTETFCDLDTAYYEQHQIVVMGARYSFGEQEYRCGSPDELDCKTFYDQIRAGGMPKTSQVSVEQATECFTRLAKEGKSILHLSFSSALSGTFQSCTIAANDVMEQFPECKIRVVDTLSASMGMGLLLDYCVHLKETGKTLDEIADQMETDRQRFCHYFTVDDLLHLHRGGRVSKMSAIVGGVLGIKPILHVDDAGRLIAIGKVRGRKQSLLALADHMEKKYDRESGIPVFISHGDCLEDAQYLATVLAERFGISDITIGEIGPAIGAHSGPGTIALFFASKDRSL